MRVPLALLTLVLLTACNRLQPEAATTAGAPDFSGIWLPDASRATTWPDPLPLNAEAQAALAAFQPDVQDPAGFCMPFGTPRNTLSTESPLEVLQTPDRVYFVFQPRLLNAETRRVYLDGRPVPSLDDAPPTWLGSSRGRWDGATLVVETVAIEPQAIVSETGLPHSAQLKVTERWSLKHDAGADLLVNDMTLTDPSVYTAPISAQRTFVKAQQARMQEGQCSERLWIDTLWRYRLEEHATAARAGKPRKPPNPAATSGTGAQP